MRASMAMPTVEGLVNWWREKGHWWRRQFWQRFHRHYGRVWSCVNLGHQPYRYWSKFQIPNHLENQRILSGQDVKMSVVTGALLLVWFRICSDQFLSSSSSIPLFSKYYFLHWTNVVHCPCRNQWILGYCSGCCHLAPWLSRWLLLVCTIVWACCRALGTILPNFVHDMAYAPGPSIIIRRMTRLGRRAAKK